MSASGLNYTLLQHSALSNGIEGEVTVNQRMLIDKMLARYSSNFAVCRELIQNSDDAEASCFQMELKSEDCNMVQEIHCSNDGRAFGESDWSRLTAIAEGNPDEDTVGMFGVGFYSVFSWTEEPMLISGDSFMSFVWKGNSLKTYRSKLDVNQKQQILESINNENKTIVVMKMRIPHLLQTVQESEEEDKNKEETNQNKFKKCKTTNNTSSPVPILNVASLSAFFSKVLSFTKHLKQLSISVNGNSLFTISKQLSNSQVSLLKEPIFSKTKIFKITQIVETQQTFRIEQKSALNIFSNTVEQDQLVLKHVSTKAEVTLEDEFSKQMHRIMKKYLPKETLIQLLYPTTCDPIILKRVHPILRGLMPLKTEEKEEVVQVCGQCFIGLATSQTTGLGISLHGQLIPTIERELIDLQDFYLRQWNSELLTTVGQVAREIYNLVMSRPVISVDTMLVASSFSDSSPNAEVGELLLEGFLASKDQDLLVPAVLNNKSVIMKSSEVFLPMAAMHLFLSDSAVVDSALYKKAQKFFQILIKYDRIRTISTQEIEASIGRTVLSSTQLIGLLHWLCSESEEEGTQNLYSTVTNRKRFLAVIRYTSIDNNSTISLFKQVKYYQVQEENSLFVNLPIPSTVLAANIARSLSSKQLIGCLKLQPFTFTLWLEWILNSKQKELLENSLLAPVILAYFSYNSGVLTATQWKTVKKGLGAAKCIPTTLGMEFPDHVYLPSPLVAKQDSEIILTIIQGSLLKSDEEEEERADDVEMKEQLQEEDIKQEMIVLGTSSDFLKAIGVHSLPSIASLLQQDKSCTLQMRDFVKSLLSQRKEMSETDFQSLKTTRCLHGSLFSSDNNKKNLHFPHKLHFPEVGTQTGMPDLLVLHWTGELKKSSAEYAFLKELGVREAPVLDDLLEYCANDSNNDATTVDPALEFFLLNFKEYYSKDFKAKKHSNIAFLPAKLPIHNATTVAISKSASKKNKKKKDQMMIDIISNNNNKNDHEKRSIVLCKPSSVFFKENPFAPVLIESVASIVKSCSLEDCIGIKSLPNLLHAIDWLCLNPPTLHTAPIVFASMNALEGLTSSVIQKISKMQFIPTVGTNVLKSPSEVFIRKRHLQPKQEENNNNTNQVNLKKRKQTNNNDNKHKNKISKTNKEEEEEPEDSDVQIIAKENKKERQENEKDSKFEALEGIIDYIDYGLEANLFLSSCHVLSIPTASILATMMLQNCYRFFFNNEENDDNDEIQEITDLSKIDVYLTALKYIALNFSLVEKPVRTRMENEAWLIAVRRSSGTKKKEASTVVERQRFYLAQPNEIYMIDDHSLERLLSPLVIPEEDGLNSLYQLYKDLGSEWISQAVKRSLNPIGNFKTSDRAQKLQELIRHRLPLLITNRRGERLPGVFPSGKRKISRLEVYEVQGIEFKITFENEVYVFNNSTQVSSCALNIDNNENTAVLYLHRASKMIDYYDVAAELTRALFAEATEELIARTTLYLSSSLDSLKRQGLPVDRLLNQYRQEEECYDNSNNSNNIRSTKIQLGGRVPNFTSQSKMILGNIDQFLNKGSAFRGNTYKQMEHIKDEVNHSCEAVPAANLVKLSALFFSIPLFLEEGISLDLSITCSAKQFAQILKGLAVDVFSISLESVHMYYDIDGARIAYNDSSSLFFNLRYFVQIHQSSSIWINCLSYWFITFCHELAHNMEANHNSLHETYVESIAAKYLANFIAFSSQFQMQVL